MANTRTETNGGSAAKVAAAITAPDVRHIEIPSVEFGGAKLRIESVTPLIMHKWSAKATKAIEDKVTGRAKAQREARDPDAERREAAHVVPGREDWEDWKPGKYCIPAEMFMHAFIYGVKQLGDTKNFPSTLAAGWLFMHDDPVLEFDSVTQRSDMGRKPTQPIYRPQFNNWACDLIVDYNARAITLEQVVSLMDMGGLQGGIGEWRRSSPTNKTGSYGRFRVTQVESL